MLCLSPAARHCHVFVPSHPPVNSGPPGQLLQDFFHQQGYSSFLISSISPTQLSTNSQPSRRSYIYMHETGVHHFQKDPAGFVSLLSCYETAWRWPDALHLLISTSSTRALISSAAGNVAMSACEKALEWEQALRTGLVDAFVCAREPTRRERSYHVASYH